MSSSGPSIRPRWGAAPITSKNAPDTPNAARRTGSPSPSSTVFQADDPTDATLPTRGAASPMSRMSRYDSSITRIANAGLPPHATTSCSGWRIGIGLSSTA